MSDVTAKIVTPPPPPQPDTRRVVLEMPYDVAVTLYRLTDFVGGHYATTYRKHVDEVASAFDEAGVECVTERIVESNTHGLWASDLPTSTE